MSYEMEVSIGPVGRRTGGALRALLGQRPTVNGSPAEVVDAWRDEHGQGWMRLRVEGEMPVFDCPGFPVRRPEQS